MLISRKSFYVLILSGALTSAAAWWVLVNPDNPFTRLFAREISDVDARIVVGPYPSDRDFRLLKANRVGLVVSLLNPAIPYEATLLEQEKARAARFGIELRNFPMSSILGQRFGNEYDQSATKAAEAIAASPEKVYLHCYLGMHRIQVVRGLLAKEGIESGAYAVRQGEREDARILLDAAEAAFGAGRYGDALDTLGRIPSQELSLDGKLLRGWCLYRLNQVAEARAVFEGVNQESPDNPPANTGLGYCAFRDGDHEAARRFFSLALAREPENADALGGMGLACQRAGDLPEAARHLRASLNVTPNNELQEVLERVVSQMTPSSSGTPR